MANKLQKLQNPLSIAFPCPANLVANEPVRIAGDLTVAKLTSAGHRDILGNVIRFLEGATCTVETSFRERRTREAYSELPVGPFVWGAASKPVAWTPSGFASVTGANSGPFAIARASVTGTNAETFAIVKAIITGAIAGPFTIELDTNDKVIVKVGSGEAQTFTLTAGVGRTAAAVAGDFSAATGFTVTVDGTQHLVFSCATGATKLEVVTVTNNAYTTLGLSVGVVEGADSIKIKVGDAVAQTFYFTPGAARTAAQLVTDMFAGIGFVASVDTTNHLVLTSTVAGATLALEAVDNDCYTALGLSIGAVESTDTISVTVGTGAPTIVTLTAGAARTATQIAGELNTAIADVTVTLSGQKLVLTCDTLLADFSIDTVTGDCYTALGVTAGAVEAIDASHSPAAIGGYVICGPEPLTLTSVLSDLYEITLSTNDTLKLKIGGGEEQSFTITPGEAVTATVVVNILNATGVGFVASVYNNRVKITCNSAWDNIEITTSNAASTLGFTVGVVTASKTVQTLEY